MSYATIDDLRSQLGAAPQLTPEYCAKMMHEIPDAGSVDRVTFLVEACRDRRVLEFGASGKAHAAIRAVAQEVLGVDRQDTDGVVGFDLDDVSQPELPGHAFDPDVIICGEVLEHLSNPGWFVTRLRRQFPDVPVILTVPNAFSSVAMKHLQRGVENVNRDHVAWYSWRTLTTLLERAGLVVSRFAWYGGRGPTAQGMVVVCDGEA